MTINAGNNINNCPFCEDSISCNHLFAIYDATWGQFEEGHFIDFSAIEKILQNYFHANIPSIRETPELINNYDDYFQEIWQDVLYINNLNNDENSRDIDLPNYSKLLFELLSNIEEPRELETYGGPGQSSQIFEFYSEDKAKTYQALLDDLVNYIN